MCVFLARKVPVCDSKAAIQLDMDISTSVWQKHYSDFPTSQMLYLHTNPPDAHAVTYVLLKAVQQWSKILKAFTKSSSTALTNGEITLKYYDSEDIAVKAMTTRGRHHRSWAPLDNQLRVERDIQKSQLFCSSFWQPTHHLNLKAGKNRFKAFRAWHKGSCFRKKILLL